MNSNDPRIDQYIAKSADFAKPILSHLRQLIHTACPGVEETMKWSFPHFQYKGALLCSMASFKNHCAFTFWKAALLKDEENILKKSGESMGHLGKITSLKDLPSDKILLRYLKEAVRLNEEGIKLEKKTSKAVPLEVPEYFSSELNKNKKALSTFQSFSPSHRNEYISWITEAKTEATKNKRMATAIEWLSEGKGRHWKYEK